MLLIYGTAATNPVENLAGAGLGRICQKGPDARPARAGAEIRYIPNIDIPCCAIVIIIIYC